MQTIAERLSRWQTGGGLPPGFSRSLDNHWVNVRRGEYYAPARGGLRGSRRQQAIVLICERRNYGVLSFEATVVREVLKTRRRWAPYIDVVRGVEPWAQGEPEAFIRRAARDKAACISVLVRVEER